MHKVDNVKYQLRFLFINFAFNIIFQLESLIKLRKMQHTIIFLFDTSSCLLKHLRYNLPRF